MFGIKTFIKNNIFYPKFLFPREADKFPEKPVSRLRLKARLFGLLSKVKEQKEHVSLGDLITFPDESAIDAWKALLPYNPNNLGNWSIRGVKPNQETAAIERELIWKIIHLYHGNKRNIEGYLTSGGTEANIFSAWVGRRSLEKKGVNKDRICLIKTSLTHYSIEKAADIVGVPTFITPLDKGTWGMDVEYLGQTIEKLYKKGYRGFLLPLTLGYTLTGTADPYEHICDRVRKLKRKLRGGNFFVWMDAALNGLIEPFLNNRFSPFKFPEQQTFLVDFHKFGFVPYPAGIVLYRKNLRNLIEKPIEYLAEEDNTVLGSRSGIPAVACWAVIHSLGKKGYKKIIKDCMARKNLFKGKMEALFPSTQIITTPYSLTLGAIFDPPKGKRLPKLIERKHGLYPGRTKILFSDGEDRKRIIYKFFFFPHQKKFMIEDFFSDLIKNRIIS